MSSKNLFEERLAQLKLRRRVSYTQLLFQYGFRDGVIFLVGGLSLAVMGLFLWCVGAAWLSDWINTLATRPDNRMGWVGYPLQFLISAIELALMMTLKENPRVILALVGFVLVDAGSNTAGVITFLSDMIAYGKLPNMAVLSPFVVVTIILVALLTYGPEKFLTLGAAMASRGWGQVTLSLEAVQLAQEMSAAGRSADPDSEKNGNVRGKGWSVVRGKKEER